MPKVKLDKFNGIYTNIDENDLTLDKFQDSVNISHEDGYIIFNDYKVATSTLPTLPVDFIWETGIYATLTEDPFDISNTGTTYNVLVLVAKKDGATIERRVYLQDNVTWYELSSEGETSGSIITMSRSFLNTTTEGNAFLKLDSGYLKLYLPHDSFWIGRLKREIWYPDSISSTTRTTFSGSWYIDRLIDKFDSDNLLIKVNDVDQASVPSSGVTTLECADDRRLGIKFNIDYKDDDPDAYINYDLITWTFGSFKSGTLPGGNDGWEVTATDSEGNIIPSPYISFFSGADRSKWYFITFDGDVADATLFITTQYHDVTTTSPDPDPMTRHDSAWYTVDKDDFLGSNFYYAPGNLVSDSGFAVTKTKYSLIVTAVLDERDEIPIHYGKEVATFTGSPTKYAIQILDLKIPTDINKRVTRFKFYIKFIDIDSDYELYKEVDLLEGEESPLIPFYMYETLRTGILLSQNIAFLFDEDKPGKYNIISGFRNIIMVNGITLGLATNINSYVYHSIVGNGVLQNNILLTENKLLIPQTSNIVAVVDINNNVGIITDQKIFMCTIGESVGQLVFEVQDSIEHGIGDPLDVIETQNTVIINTRNGIYKTNGYEVKLLSQPINDIVKTSYENYNLIYNPHKHLLYYYTDTDTFYQFRFDYEKWEKFTIPSSSELVLILIDFDGNPVYLYSDELYAYSVSGTGYSTGYCITNHSDLGEASIDKLLNYIDIDYSGSCSIQVFYDNIAQFTLIPDILTSRGTRQIYIPLSNRHPLQKLRLLISFNTITTRINKLELDFGTLKRKYHD